MELIKEYLEARKRALQSTNQHAMFSYISTEERSIRINEIENALAVLNHAGKI